MELRRDLGEVHYPFPQRGTDGYRRVRPGATPNLFGVLQRLQRRPDLAREPVGGGGDSAELGDYDSGLEMHRGTLVPGTLRGELPRVL